jgi:cysteine-rich repeat protein
MDAPAKACDGGDMRRCFDIITIMGLLFACTVDEPTLDTAGSTTNPGDTETSDVPDLPSDDETSTTGELDPICGDGVVDPGEDCDDANDVDGDGCTATCELGPCAWEWVRRDPALTSEGEWLVVSPQMLDAEGPWIAHQIDPHGERGTRLLHAAAADGSPLTVSDFDLTPGEDYIYGVVLDPSGDVFLAHSRFDIQTSEIRRMQPDGTELWVHSHDSFAHVAGLSSAPNGDLIFVTSTEVGPMDRDAAIVALDPADGSERWVQTYSGTTAPNGYSFDYGAGLVIDDGGRRFVAIDEYVDWDTVTPVVAAYAPGDSGEPLWVTPVVDAPGERLGIYATAVGPDGTLAVGFKSNEGTQPFWIAALDGATGSVQWVFERDDLGIEPWWSIIRGIAISQDRVMAVGTWNAEVDGQALGQAYALGLNLDGSLSCLTTLDNSYFGTPAGSVLPAAIAPSAMGFRVAGFATVDGIAIDLLQAQIR